MIAANNPAITRGIQPGDVVDADPRIISNLIVDQTANNPAALFKALQDAGLSNADAFTQLGIITAAVDAVKTARAEAAGSSAAVAAAASAVTVAQQNSEYRDRECRSRLCCHACCTIRLPRPWPRS